MKRIIFSLAILMTCITTYAQNNVYTLVKPDCSNISLSVGHQFNNKVGDYDFNHNYFVVGLEIGKYLDRTVGITGDFSIASSNEGAKTRLYNIGMLINLRLTNYYEKSPIDVVFNLGGGYGRFDFTECWMDSEGMDYFVPKVSLDIVFNLSSNKAYQFALSPSYQYYIGVKDKYYYDDGTKVKGNISLIGITGKFRVNF